MAKIVSAGNLNEDRRVDPHGSFLAAQEPSPVYPLVGEPGLIGETAPAIDETRRWGHRLSRARAGHTTGPNSPPFLDWAARIWSGNNRCAIKPRPSA